MELRPTSAGNGSSLTLAESNFCIIFLSLGLQGNLKLQNRLSKTVLNDQAVGVVKYGQSGVPR